MAIGHEAEATNAMEAIGQHVKEKAADELVGFELHDLGGAVLTIVFPGEGDVIVVERRQVSQSLPRGFNLLAS